MDITSFVMGYKKGIAAAKGETDFEILEGLEFPLDFSNGDMEFAAPDGVLVKSAVIAKPETLVPENIAEGVDIAGIIGTLVAGSGGGDVKYFYGSVTIPSGGGRVSVNFGFAPDFLLLFPGDKVSVADTISMLFVGTSSKFAEIFGSGGSQNAAYVYSNKITRQSCGSGIDMVITGATSQKIHTANATGFTLGTKLSAGTWYAYAFGF